MCGLVGNVVVVKRFCFCFWGIFENSGLGLVEGVGVFFLGIWERGGEMVLMFFLV